MKVQHPPADSVTLAGIWDPDEPNILATLAAPPAIFAPGEINVQSYGAAPDGRTDDTAAIQAARNSAALNVASGSSWIGSGATLQELGGSHGIASLVQATNVRIAGA